VAYFFWATLYIRAVRLECVQLPEATGWHNKSEW